MVSGKLEKASSASSSGSESVLKSSGRQWSRGRVALEAELDARRGERAGLEAEVRAARDERATLEASVSRLHHLTVDRTRAELQKVLEEIALTDAAIQATYRSRLWTLKRLFGLVKRGARKEKRQASGRADALRFQSRSSKSIRRRSFHQPQLR